MKLRRFKSTILRANESLLIWWHISIN